MAIQGEVKFKVRRSVLMLKRFTVKQLLVTARVPESSARTEVNRMVKEGLLSTQQADVEMSSTGGRPPVIYEIVPGTQAKIYASIEPFYGVPRDGTAPPTSENYKRARDTLNNLLRSGQLMTEEEWTDVINEALRDLEYAEFEEDIGTEGAEIVGAYIEIEKAKARALAGDLRTALQLKNQIQRAVESSGLSTGEVQARLDQVDECIYIREIQPELHRANQAVGELDFQQAVQVVQRIVDMSNFVQSSNAFITGIFEFARSWQTSLQLARIWYASIQQTDEWRESVDRLVKILISDRMEARLQGASVSGAEYGMEEDISPSTFGRLGADMGLEQAPWMKPTATD